MKKFELLPLLFLFSFYGCQKEDIALSFTTPNQRFRQSSEWNDTHPFRKVIVPTENYSILCMGDSHVGTTTNLDIFFDNAKILNASAAVMVGDLTTGNKNDYLVFQRHIPVQDSFPSFPIVGNHDLYYDGWSEFFSKFGSSTYLFSVETPSAMDLFICLDAASGTLGNEQIDWLKKVLQSRRSMYRYCLVFTHNNFFLERHTDSAAISVEEVNLLLGIFAANKVNMVISGHDHSKAVRSMGLTRYIIMDALRDGLGNAGFLEIKLKTDILEYKFQNIQ